MKSKRSLRNRLLSAVHRNKIYPLVLVVLCMLVFWPMLIGNSQFFVDWVNSYWLVLVSRDNPFPQWTMGDVIGVAPLEPWQLYYGSNWYGLIGLISRLFDKVGVSTITVYRFSYVVLAITTALSLYGILRSVRIRESYSFCIAAIAVTSTYYLTNAFGRGAYTEFVASSLLIPMAYSLVVFVRSNSLSKRTIAAICHVTLVALFLTTHNLSILLFTIFVSSLCVSLVWYFRPTSIKQLTHVLSGKRHQILSAVTLTLAGLILASPQFLVAVLTGTRTSLGQPSWIPFTEFSSVGIVLRPWPFTPATSTTPDMKTQASSLLLLFVVVLAVHLYLKKRISSRSLGYMFSIVTSSLVVTSCSVFWKVAPSQLQTIQYTYRYVNYLNLAIFVASAIAIRELNSNLEAVKHKTQRTYLVALSLITTTSIVFATWQTREARLREVQVNIEKVNSSELPDTWYAPFGFRIIGDKVAPLASSETVWRTSNKVHIIVRCAGTDTVEVPIPFSPLIKAEEAALMGSSPSGYVVLRIDNCRRNNDATVILKSGFGTRKVQSLYVLALSISVLMLGSVLWTTRNRETWGQNIESSV